MPAPTARLIGLAAATAAGLVLTACTSSGHPSSPAASASSSAASSVASSTPAPTVSTRASSGQLGKTIVFALGTNGTFSPDAFAQLVSLTAGRHLVVVTSHCPYCSWTPTNNAMVHARCTAANHCAVADWDALADRNPAWFSGDGVHMGIGGAGAQAYAALVRATA